jgi:hypothetical protein
MLHDHMCGACARKMVYSSGVTLLLVNMGLDQANIHFSLLLSVPLLRNLSTLRNRQKINRQPFTLASTASIP